MQFSLWPLRGKSWDEILERAKWAEAHDFHGVWVADHLMQNLDDGRVHLGEQLECWSVLAGLAVAVPRLRLVSMVSPVTIHHPVLLAKRATTVDHLSGGRVTLGLGAGWQVNEHRAYGFELPPAAERVDRFEEAIRVVHSLLHLAPGEVATYASPSGRYHLDGAPFSPAPVQSPLPLLVGTGSSRMMRLCATWADEWNTWGHVDEQRIRHTRFLAACERVGRDPGTVRRSAQAMLYLVRTPDERTRAEAARIADRTVIGGPGELVDHLGQLREMGIDEFAIPDVPLGATPSERAERLDDLYSNVIVPLMRG